MAAITDRLKTALLHAFGLPETSLELINVINEQNQQITQLTTKFDDLLVKLDSDAGVSDTDYLASLEVSEDWDS
jgi:hypothetical protein